jgi:2-aminobenzoate-CoA ligase
MVYTARETQANVMLAYPPKELWPEKIYSLPELSYPATINAGHELLDLHLAQGRGALPAIHFGGSTIHYNDLHDDVLRIAGGLLKLGVQPGDCVVLRLLNRPHFISTFLALLRVGAVAAPTPPLLRAREIAAIIESAEPALLITESDLWEELRRLGPTSVPFVNVDGIRGTPAYQNCVPTLRDAPAVLLFTSGSTGAPKGCIHSHSDLLAVCDTYARNILEPTSADRFGGHPTMAFAYGLGGLLLFPLRFGASSVLLDRFTPEAMIESIRRNNVTIAFCAPVSMRLMMKHSSELRATLQSLRFMVTAGESLPAALYRSWRDATGIEPLDGIGSTELLHIFISSRPGRSKAGSTGEVVPGYQAKVMDEKTMEPVPDGEAGLLAVKGPTGCRYLGATFRQQAYVRQGWNIPGDIYVRDSDGYLYYQCRNDDIIISGGINIAAPEVEAVLVEHPAVSEVAIVASPDETYGMVAKAFVVLQNHQVASDDLKKDLQDFVRRELAPYKCPRRIAFVSELPKTSTGKIRRSELRRQEAT